MDTKEQTEIARLRSEVQKNEAEKRKLELEALEIQKRLKQRWFSGRVFLQALIGGVIGSEKNWGRILNINYSKQTVNN